MALGDIAAPSLHLSSQSGIESNVCAIAYVSWTFSSQSNGAFRLKRETLASSEGAQVASVAGEGCVSIVVTRAGPIYKKQICKP